MYLDDNSLVGMHTAVSRDVLVDLLLNGDNTPTNIAESTGRHTTSVSRKLSDLEEQGLVINKGRGVWTLTMKGMRHAQVFRRHRES